MTKNNIHCFFNPLSKNFYRELVNCTDFNDLIDICVENINNFFLQLNIFMVLKHAIQKVVRLDHSVRVWKTI